MVLNAVHSLTVPLECLIFLLIFLKMPRYFDFLDGSYIFGVDCSSIPCEKVQLSFLQIGTDLSEQANHFIIDMTPDWIH